MIILHIFIRGLPIFSVGQHSLGEVEWKYELEKKKKRASLMVRCLRIHLAMQGIPVRFLAWEDPTCLGATKPAHHDYLAL